MRFNWAANASAITATLKEKKGKSEQVPHRLPCLVSDRLPTLVEAGFCVANGFQSPARHSHGDMLFPEHGHTQHAFEAQLNFHQASHSNEKARFLAKTGF